MDTNSSLEAQVERGQQALGRLIRQFLAVNDFKHVQLMAMANALMGVRWIHSSQISTLKKGGTKNLTGFPLYSVACINRRIWEINQGLSKHPKGTKDTDWENKLPMMRDENTPLDVGDLWRIYFGEMDPPLFSGKASIEITDKMAIEISRKMAALFALKASQGSIDSMGLLQKIIDQCRINEMDHIRMMKIMLLGISELDSESLTEIESETIRVFAYLNGKKAENLDLYSLCGDDDDAEINSLMN